MKSIIIHLLHPPLYKSLGIPFDFFSISRSTIQCESRLYGYIYIFHVSLAFAHFKLTPSRCLDVFHFSLGACPLNASGLQKRMGARKLIAPPSRPTRYRLVITI